jgi:acyl-CoA reductase-like NAD-dependent aldehyde dehydrogenase
MIKRDKLYINGEWVLTKNGAIEVVNPYTEKTIATIPAGSGTDVDHATRSARSAFAEWAAQSIEQRAGLLKKIHQGLVARQDEIAQLITAEVGMPLKMSKRIQAFLPAAVLESYCKLAETFSFKKIDANSIVIKEPVGVVACITPWNYPLHQIVAKVAPALLAGCTVVLKPSEVAPLTAFLLAEIVAEAGLPAGVFNLVTGDGPAIGEALVKHKGIDMVSFTGSVEAGKRVASLAALDVKRVTLELGGKSASIILDDADIVKAVKSTVNGCFLNSGQTCNALTRLLVPEDRYDEVSEIAVDICKSFTLGDPSKPETKTGPLVSEKQRSRVRTFIEAGVKEGAVVLCGGSDAPQDVEQGYFVKPTILGRVTPEMTVAQSEIFGPVLCIMTYKSEDEAIRIANDSNYGLSGAVWSGDSERAMQVAKAIRTGQVDINGGAFNLLAPFGGFKQSGYGRELGEYGLDEFLELKSIQT